MLIFYLGGEVKGHISTKIPINP